MCRHICVEDRITWLMLIWSSSPLIWVSSLGNQNGILASERLWIQYWKRFPSLTKKVFSPPPGFWLSRKYVLMYYAKGGLHGRMFMKINFILKHILYLQYSLSILNKNIQKPTCLIFCFFCFNIFVKVIQISFNSPQWECENKIKLFWKF